MYGAVRAVTSQKKNIKVSNLKTDQQKNCIRFEGFRNKVLRKKLVWGKNGSRGEVYVYLRDLTPNYRKFSLLFDYIPLYLLLFPCYHILLCTKKRKKWKSVWSFKCCCCCVLLCFIFFSDASGILIKFYTGFKKVYRKVFEETKGKNL